MSRRHLSLAATFLVAIPALPATAAAAVQQVEQINRLSGTQGAFSLLWSGENQSYPSVVSDDGRYATFYVNGPAESDPAPVPGPGLYFRDIVDNTTTKIAGPNTLLTGLDTTGTKVSFITAEKLDPADTNGISDLYYRDGATGRNVLLSRANGLNGKATGVTSQGALARGGRYAIFGAPNGTHRRDLQTGVTKKVAYGGFLNYLPAGFPGVNTPGDYGNYTADQFVSDDGQVAWTGELFISPKGLQYPPFSIYEESGYKRYPLITRDGENAVWQEAIPAEEEAPGTSPYALG
ncbi:MAG: hypothetical protein Q7T55_21800, partial [Solirubrobacteraceae bacterium]|nr:hypothetical protein [Solirubrobacteraceae bacterium]